MFGRWNTDERNRMTARLEHPFFPLSLSLSCQKREREREQRRAMHRRDVSLGVQWSVRPHLFLFLVHSALLGLLRLVPRTARAG